MERHREAQFFLIAALAMLGLVGFIACAGGSGSETPEPPPPGPSVNHATHALNELVCTDCHDIEETGEPKMPVIETCFDCHELAEETDEVKAYFDAIRQEDGSYLFPKLAASQDLNVNHKGHAEQGVECKDCHGEPAETRFARPAPMDRKETCQSCHKVNDAPMECATCHKEYRQDVAPASHTSAFKYDHGDQAPADWLEGGVSSCSQCHDVPQSCIACHKLTKPRSHVEAGFEQNHGKGDTDALDWEDYGETSCANCHEDRASCIRCHMIERPRSHTTTFNRRTHGLVADIERESCRVCHKQDFCLFCHQSTQPLNHRGNWDQMHCVTCHEPLTQSGCFVCHKNTASHLAATPLPSGLPHSAATDCRTCHTVIPHLDDGGSCRRCHK